mmetsp:Transcript_5654/g.12264  ORF Transcript_5654/g.12264 Transcript_5654/m.12264 type:complete len:200 (-) Transcript_5654:14-613(-)
MEEDTFFCATVTRVAAEGVDIVPIMQRMPHKVFISSSRFTWLSSVTAMIYFTKKRKCRYGWHSTKTSGSMHYILHPFSHGWVFGGCHDTTTLFKKSQRRDNGLGTVLMKGPSPMQCLRQGRIPRFEIKLVQPVSRICGRNDASPIGSRRVHAQHIGGRIDVPSSLQSRNKLLRSFGGHPRHSLYQIRRRHGNRTASRPI